METDVNQLREVWKRASDSDVVKAAKDWAEYSRDARAVIEAEARGRGLWGKTLALMDGKISEPISIDGSDSVAKKKQKPILDLIVRFASIAIGFVFWKFLGVAPFVLFFLILICAWFPKWYFKRHRVNHAVGKCIVWSNILTWFLPPLGMLTGFTALELSNVVEQEKKTYKVLAFVGIGLSLANAIAGIIIRWG